MLEMHVAGIALDARNGQPIVVLNDETKRRALPIWIGMAEANSIMRALENLKAERPMTHDLMLDLLVQMGYRVERIEINELTANTYFASIFLTINGKQAGGQAELQPMDSRPSDAIALALRAGSPIFVSAQVVADGTIPTDSEKDEEEAAEFKQFVEGLKASDFHAPGQGA